MFVNPSAMSVKLSSVAFLGITSQEHRPNHPERRALHFRLTMLVKVPASTEIASGIHLYSNLNWNSARRTMRELTWLILCHFAPCKPCSLSLKRHVCRNRQDDPGADRSHQQLIDTASRGNDSSFIRLRFH